MLRDNLVGAHRADAWQRGSLFSRAVQQKQSSDDRPLCLENPRPERGGIYTSGERLFSISR
jgi:hypothetical protein